MTVSIPLQQTFLAMANSISIVMNNAGSNQMHCQLIATSSTTKCCEMIIKSTGTKKKS